MPDVLVELSEEDVVTEGEKVIERARTQIGVHEDPPRSNRARPPRVYMIGDAWCGRFARWAYTSQGIDDGGLGSPSTWQIYENGKRAGRLRSEPLMGCYVVWSPGPTGHVELFIRWIVKGVVALTIGGNTGDAVREHVRNVQGAHFVVPPVLEEKPPAPVYETVYWWEDPAATPDRHGLYVFPAYREYAIAKGVAAKDFQPGHVRRGTVVVRDAKGHASVRYTFWTGPRKRSPDFRGKGAKKRRDADRRKVADQRPGHIIRPRSRRELVEN